ncbi:acetyl-CoA C-acetyltransferase [Gammaproteobacteria bacterium]|nr:acetyl-CoA C-acetyltransferase [Gammaproteobacteria bacterium]MDA9154058.1 acetyl-CoA C-acetyltransferase [Gammaproteobacteria bacterium]MDA9973978.1 acetyl-CoA C-acetyltransferase [Gammaproteobacteria bacterium]MDB4210137.1 acetyl-CoA C-acetyltransferase [Gammaproteobacteria bacterium]MDB9700821.1 acetyl-CoA C-acetyltransferase [Gammaproteobacteria bacterium]|tara:strand:+ start:2642 stop:3796 length:1155 start_codon:yes stop_codon:yes gene_type:complete
MQDAYIVSALRTPIGKKKGSLSGMHPADLGASVLSATFDQVDLDPGLVDDVIFGCVDTVGPQAGDIARTCWLAAGLPEHVPGTTVDRQCGSSQQAVHFATQAVMSGTSDVVVAGGVQNMNMIPISYAMLAGQALGFTDPFSGSKGWVERYGTQEVSQFNSAHMIAEKWKISREEMELFAFNSHQKAMRAIESKVFSDEIISIGDFHVDETPRPDTSLEKMASLNPLVEGHSITAAISSQNADAASALLVVSEKILKEFNLTPLVRVAHISVRADDPIWMLTAPMPATRHAVQKSGIQLKDIGLVEINEAFASVAMAWQKEMDYPIEQMNIHGGAIALGHPLGATGARLMTTLIHSMKRDNVKFGLQTMCEGGGQANVTILENCS